MGSKRKPESSAIPTTSKSSRLMGSSSAVSAASTSTSTSTQVGTGGGQRSGVGVPNSESGGGFSGQPHPLMNQVVLSNLFSFTPPELLTTCRLVCKTWRDHSRPAWRSSLIPKFTYSEDDDDEDGHVSVAVGKGPLQMSLTEFQELWRNEFGDLPYQNIHLEVCGFDFGAGTDDGNGAEQLLELLGATGRSIKKLSLLNCGFGNVAVFRMVIFQSFPNLQSLILDHPRITVHPPMEQPANDLVHLEPARGEHPRLKSLSVKSRGSMSVPVSWAELLSHFPALTAVKLSYAFPPGGYYTWPPAARPFERHLWPFIEAVSMIRRDNPNKLPELLLDLDPPLGFAESRAPQIFNRIRQLNLHLDSIRINLNCNFNVAKNMIKYHGRTLSKIENYMDDLHLTDSIPSPIHFPRVELSCLKELTLSDVFCRNMGFLKYTPNLSKLRMFTMGPYLPRGGEQDPLETGLISSTSTRNQELANLKLLTLKHLYFCYRLSNDDLRRLCSWFPNVQSLSLFLDNEQFGMVCQNWPDLKHLHVLGKELNDQGLIGMGPPNVTNLKDLLCFKMESTPTPSICITDVSARQGFRKLKKLRHLDISRYINNFSPEETRRLRKTIPDCQVDHYYPGSPANEKRDMCPEPIC